MANEKKSKQLGIPFGTANGRLRKLIMFDLVRRLGLDVCCVCNKPILSVDEFSIEHKTPWLDNDPALFWDIDNIGFAHIACNISLARRKKYKKPAPDGTQLCTSCDTIKHVKEFPPSIMDKWQQCTKCGTDYKKEWRKRSGKH